MSNFSKAFHASFKKSYEEGKAAKQTSGGKLLLVALKVILILASIITVAIIRYS